MWAADLIDKPLSDDGRLRYVVVFHDDTRKLPPESFYAPNVRAQVIARVNVLNAQDTVKPDDISPGPIDLTPIDNKLTDVEQARADFFTLDAKVAVALQRQQRGWPNSDVVNTLQAQLSQTYLPEYN